MQRVHVSCTSLAVGVELEEDGSQHGRQHEKQPQEAKQLQLTSSETVLHDCNMYKAIILASPCTFSEKCL